MIAPDQLQQILYMLGQKATTTPTPQVMPPRGDGANGIIPLGAQTISPLAGHEGPMSGLPGAPDAPGGPGFSPAAVTVPPTIPGQGLSSNNTTPPPFANPLPAALPGSAAPPFGTQFPVLHNPALPNPVAPVVPPKGGKGGGKGGQGGKGGPNNRNALAIQAGLSGGL